ncbi:MAG: hypothetical protein ACRYGP_21690 [Janthinobacterium lividum]
MEKHEGSTRLDREIEYLIERQRLEERRFNLAMITAMALLGFATLSVGAGLVPILSINSPNSQFLLACMMSLWSAALGFYVGRIGRARSLRMKSEKFDIESETRNRHESFEMRDLLLRQEAEFLQRRIDLERRILAISKELQQADEVSHDGSAS